MKILVVDDDDLIREMISMQLGDDYDVTDCATVDEAVAALEKDQYGLLITDVFMPEKNGVELTEYVKHNHPGVPVLAISGAFSEDPGNEGEVAGYFADGMLSKPFKKEDLHKAVQNLLANQALSGFYG